jgi:trigger factor
MEHNHLPELISEVVRGKALASIVEAAVVTDASGAVVELKRLQQDGTLADQVPVDVADGDAEGLSDGGDVADTEAVDGDVADTAPQPVVEQA